MEKSNEEILSDEGDRSESLEQEESSIKEGGNTEELEITEEEDLDEKEYKTKSTALDEEIEEALERDRIESAEMSKVVIDTEYVSDVAIYEDEEELLGIKIEESDEHKKKTNKIKYYYGTLAQQTTNEFSKLSKRTVLIAAGTLLGAVVLFGGTAILLAKSYNEKSERISNHTISNTDQTYNNLNFVFLEDEVDFEDSSLILNKVLIDNVATIFYFNKSIDEQKYHFSLTDNYGTRYSLDLPTVIQKGIVKDDNPTILKFEGLNKNAKSIDLKLTNIETKEETSFYFFVDKNSVVSSSKYLTTPMRIQTNSPSIVASIENAVFSNSGTNISFKLEWQDDSEVIQMGSNYKSELISLKEGGKTILPKYSSVHKYNFDEEKTILGRLEFDAVRNLDSKLNLKFKDIYRKTYINKDIPVSKLLSRTENSSEVFQLNNYKVVLEAMGKQGSNYILTVHTEDTGVLAYSKDSNEFNNLVNTMLEAQLVCESVGGAEIIIDGENFNGDVGSDIVFNASAIMDLNIPIENMTLRVKSVMMKIDEVGAYLDLSKVKYYPDTNTNKALDTITSAFRSRLAYKSGEIDEDDIKSFSPEVLSSTRLMRNYKQLSLTEPAFYSAQVISYSLEDKKFMGVIAESWEGIEENEYKEFFRTHKVIAERNEQGDFIITSDTILN